MSELIFCKYCGQAVDVNSVYCRKCGKYICHEEEAVKDFMKEDVSAEWATEEVEQTVPGAVSGITEAVNATLLSVPSPDPEAQKQGVTAKTTDRISVGLGLFLVIWFFSGVYYAASIFIFPDEDILYNICLSLLFFTVFLSGVTNDRKFKTIAIVQMCFVMAVAVADIVLLNLYKYVFTDAEYFKMFADNAKAIIRVFIFLLYITLSTRIKDYYSIENGAKRHVIWIVLLAAGMITITFLTVRVFLILYSLTANPM